MKVLQKGELTYLSIIDSMRDPVIACDRKGCITFSNTAVGRIFGYQPDELMGKAVSTLFSSAEGGENRRLESALAGERVADFETSLIDKNGTYVPVCLTLSTLRSEAGKIGGVAYVIRTIGILKRAERKFQVLFESAPDAMIIINTFEQIVLVNEKASRLFGYEHADFVGKPVDMFIFNAYRNTQSLPLQEFLSRQLDNLPGTGLELYGRRQNGTEFPIEITINRVETDDGLLILVALRDMTIQKKSLEALKEYGSRLEVSNSELEKFAYVASHDLQEQLRNITNYVGLIEKYTKVNTDEEFNYFLGVISSSSHRMNLLIGELLNFSRIGRNKIIEKVDCRTLMNEITGDLEFLINEKGARIHVGDMPVIDGSSAEIKLLFRFLLENALKFNKPSVAAEINVLCENKAAEWEFSVGDNGIGINEEYFQKIFMIFQRLHPEDYPGIGMGLAVCKKIVNWHKGRLWVKSTPEAGSVFYFTIPKY